METDYVSYIEKELSHRKTLKESYSLRAFAKDLGVSPSTLSEVIKRKHNLSLKNAKKIVAGLDLSFAEKQNFLELVSADKDTTYEKIRKKVYGDTSLDLYRIISDWYHFAILEISNTKDFCPTETWLSKHLKVSESEISSAVARLKKIGAIQIIDGCWVVHRNYSQIFAGKVIPEDAIKKFQAQVLKKILVNLEGGESSHTLIGLAEDEYELIKEKLNKTRSELFRDIKGGKKQKLYALGLQIVPLID